MVGSINQMGVGLRTMYMKCIALLVNREEGGIKIPKERSHRG